MPIMQDPVASDTSTTAASNVLPSASTVASDAPASLQSFGATPSVTPTYVDPNQNNQYLNEYLAQLQTSLQPQFQAQDQTLQDQDAARGISSSGAAGYLGTQLAGQQDAAYASAAMPIIQQGYGYTQQDITGNAAAANAAAGTNAAYYDQALTTNAGDYNGYLTMLEQQGYNTGNEGYEAYLGSYGPNSGIESLMGTGESATLGAYGNVYDQALNSQNQTLGELGGAAGDAFSTAIEYGAVA